MFRSFISILVILTTASCSMHTKNVKPSDGSSNVMFGSGVTTNNSPSTVGLMCTGRSITNQSKTKDIRVAVGQFSDLTGKFSNDDAGYKITQGAHHMVITALGKLDTTKVNILERSDTSVFNFELNLANNKLIGGGAGVKYKLPDGTIIPYKPTMAGSVVGSDYFITGAITELNYNIGSGGLDPTVSNIELGRREYRMNIAIDIRMVNTKTLQVVKAITLQKQIVGYEWKLNLFRFFGSELIDLNAGQKNDEPVHLGVRTVIEQGVAELMSHMYNIDTRQFFINVEKDFDAEWIRNPVKVADNMCPKVIAPVLIKHQKDEPKQTVKKERKIYNPGACTNIVDECQMCALRKISQKPLASQPHGFYVQVAAHDDKKDAFNEWTCLEKNYASLVNDQSYVVKRNSIGLYALQIGPFKSNKEASNYCSIVKTRNLDCYVERVN